MVDKLHEHEDNINRISSHNNGEAKKLFELENVVYDRDEKMDAFDKLHTRIT
jgi:hypothetical protein